MRSIYQNTIAWSGRIHWSLLLLLVLVLNVKMLVKFAAVLVLLVINRKLFLDKEGYKQRFTWFYWGMIVIAGFNFLLSLGSFSLNYGVAVFAAVSFWFLCLATAYLNYWFVKTTDTRKLEYTISFFFVANAVVSIIQLLMIMWDAGSLNPYTYQGEFQKYFINTGDRIKGITFDLSATNSFINAFGIVYFVYKEKIGQTLLCMLVLLLAVSNYTNILLLVVLGIVFVFQSNRLQKSLIVTSFLLMAIFMFKVSPHNSYYIEDFFTKMAGGKLKDRYIDLSNMPGKPDSLLSPDERRKKFAKHYIDSINSQQVVRNTGTKAVEETGKLSIPKPNIHSAPYWRKIDTTALQREMLQFIAEKIEAPDTALSVVRRRELPGKFMAFRQIVDYFRVHPARILTGTGAGNFSSKLAFRTTGMHIAGGYPERFTRINQDFLDNHFRLYLDYFSKDIELHSLIHSPNSVYAQVLSEYGLIGLGCFFFFYILYFIRKTGWRGYGWPLMLILLGALATDYWFEHLSIVIIFELLMLLRIKERHAEN